MTTRNAAKTRKPAKNRKPAKQSTLPCGKARLPFGPGYMGLALAILHGPAK